MKSCWAHRKWGEQVCYSVQFGVIIEMDSSDCCLARPAEPTVHHRPAELYTSTFYCASALRLGVAGSAFTYDLSPSAKVRWGFVVHKTFSGASQQNSVGEFSRKKKQKQKQNDLDSGVVLKTAYTSLTVCQSVWHLWASGNLNYAGRAIWSHFLFPSVIYENATLFCCKASKKFYGLQILTRISIATGVSRSCINVGFGWTIPLKLHVFTNKWIEEL